MRYLDYIPTELLHIFRQSPVLQQGKAYLTGGAVRDLITRGKNTDFDIEVYGVSSEDLGKALSRWGKVFTVGKSFGVMKLKTDSNYQYDFSLPRQENKLAPGHKGFQVIFNPNLSPREAAARRDFTFNAMMIDLSNGELLDFYGGIEDIRNRILRHVSPAFVEDPLRVLRGMQFAARFGLRAAPETIELCRSILSSYNELSVERIYGEWIKWATLSKVPSFGILFLEQTGWIAHTPELMRLRDCPQDPIWHPEGDVLTHSLMACDALVRQDGWVELDAETRATLLFATLCHDFGKPDTLSYTEEDGIRRIHSYKHARVGIPKIKEFLARIDIPFHIRQRIIPLIENHITSINTPDITARAVRRLALRLTPETIENLVRVILADQAACGQGATQIDRSNPRILNIANELSIANTAPKPILTGTTIIKETGLHTGTFVGKIKEAAFQAQLDGVITDIPSAITWLRQNYSSIHSPQQKEFDNEKKNV